MDNSDFIPEEFSDAVDSAKEVKEELAADLQDAAENVSDAFNDAAETVENGAEQMTEAYADLKEDAAEAADELFDTAEAAATWRTGRWSCLPQRLPESRRQRPSRPG